MMSKLIIVVFSLLGLLSACVGLLLPGQCDEAIPVQQDFDILQYQGQWFEVEAYPESGPTVVGTCHRATYSYNALPTPVLSITSTHVSAQDLQTDTRTASATPTDPAKFTFADSTSTGPRSYWILATDYTTYSLAYSCHNVGTTQREVFSWKLGRQTTLPAAAVTAINEVINRVEALEQDRYDQSSHTAQDCVFQITGSCDTTIRGVTPFDINDFAGTWYEHERYPNTAQTGQCNRATYEVTGEGVLVADTQVIDESLHAVAGTATVANNYGEFSIQYAGSVNRVDVVVLATDNRNYALLYSCQNLPNNRKQVNSWILSKNRGPLETQDNNAINTAINGVNDLQRNVFLPTSRSPDACFYYPEFDELPGSIDLPEACPTNIRGVPNFNANAFSGQWFEVERYPQPALSGQCNRVEYSGVTGGSISIVNTEVENEALNTLEGTATVSADGYADLTVQLNIGGVTTPRTFHILDTDHTNYALVYSCTNLENGWRRVSSWKLSKTTELRPQDSVAINEAISSIQGLRQDYYQPTSQTHDSCFYYPVFDELPDTIELRGPCPTNIRGIPNFNAAAFVGEWFEIERYPQPQPSAECRRVRYGALTNGAIAVENTHVINEALHSLEGAATLTPDLTGEFEVIYTDPDGEPRRTNYQVLDTDYNNYAFLYSCVTLNNDRRRVGSWKLSRSAQLSPQNSTAINEIISTTQGLRQNYYQSISQTVDSCFYYPVYDELPESIDLRGPCPTNIRGMPDFNAAAFAGDWFEIERYPHGAQSGQCNRARYQVQENGGISVENSEVINEDLSTITGVGTVNADNFGEFVVDYTVDGATRRSTFHVLTTDYSNHALIYSCENLANGWRRVGSWKLSRATALRPQDNASINPYVTGTQGLSQAYYQTTSHSDAACFHYPEQTGTHVVIPGQCDTSIPAVTEFDVEKFTGIWYQIQRYDAVGARSCIGTRLRYDGDTANIRINHVVMLAAEELQLEGTGQLSSTDGTGQFTLALPIENSEDGEPVETPIRILATDYEGYAVGYNCLNLDSSRRQIRAWQLSRERTLSEASQTAIATLIGTRQELHTPYFNTVPQQDTCPEPNSAFLFKSSIIVILVCSLLQLLR